MEAWSGQADRASSQRPKRTQAEASAAPARPAALAVGMDAAMGPCPTDTRQKSKGSAKGSGKSADLLQCTAELALETARNVRCLSSIALRTITISDTCNCGQGIVDLAAQEQTYNEMELVYTWAALVLVILRTPQAVLPEASMEILRRHSGACPTAECLKEHIKECSVTRTYTGTASNIRLAGSYEVQDAMQAVCRCLVAMGGVLRFGAAPRGGKERAVLAALQASRRG